MYHTNKHDFMNRYKRSEENDLFQTPARAARFNQTMAQSSSSTDTSPDTFPELGLQHFPPEFRFETKRPEFHQIDRMPYNQQDYMNTFKRDMFQSHIRPENNMIQSNSNANDLFQSLTRAENDKFPSYSRAENDFLQSLTNTEKEMFLGHTRTENDMFQGHIRNENGIYQGHNDSFENIFSHIPELGTKELNNPIPTEVIYDSPLARHHRPIMGRNIMTNEPLTTIEEFPWQYMAQTPPKSVEQKYIQNYELFSSEKQAFELPSPVKTSPETPHTSPLFGTPPRMSMTPRTSTPVTTPPKSPFSPRMTTPFKEPLGSNVSLTSNYGSNKMCMFCRKNGETPLVYMTHAVKEKVGNKTVVTCPILRSHVCSMCGASGDNAHTITYCPVVRNGNNGQPLQSTTITLKNTRIKSNGRRRY